MKLRFANIFTPYMILITVFAGWKVSQGNDYVTLFFTWLGAAIFGVIFCGWYAGISSKRNQKH